MNKHLLVIGAVIPLLAVGLSGCNELEEPSNNISGDEDLVEIYDVNILVKLMIIN